MRYVEIISNLKKKMSLYTVALGFPPPSSFIFPLEFSQIHSHIFPPRTMETLLASMKSTNFPLLFHCVSSGTLLSSRQTALKHCGSRTRIQQPLFAFPVYPRDNPACLRSSPSHSLDWALVCPASFPCCVPSLPLASATWTVYKECRSIPCCTALCPGLFNSSLGLEFRSVLGENLVE